MKRTFLFLLLLCFLTVGFAEQAAATIRVVDNRPNAAGFSTFQAAHDASAAGDTIYVLGSPITHGGTTALTKRLVVIGNGYFLPDNPQTQANLNPTTFSNFTFNTGSSGSTVVGCTFVTLYYGLGGGDNLSNITVRRCRIQSGISYFTGNHTNLIVEQCYFDGGGPVVFQMSSGCFGMVFRNNYIGGDFTIPAASAATVSNNICIGRGNTTQLNNTTFQNNILVGVSALGGTASTILNNIATNTVLPAGNGNQNSVAIATVVLNAGSPDAQWQLAAGSPAIGAGTGGENIGMFGGTSPYVLSGIPALPTIYEFISPTAGNGATGLPVQLKVKSRN